MSIRVSNNAVSALSVSIDESTTTIQVRTGEGDRFPLLSEGQWFPATIISTDGSFEIIKVTERDSDILTVVRGQEGTVAKPFLAGSPVELRLTAEVIAEILGKIHDAADAVSAAQGTADEGVGKAEAAQDTADAASGAQDTADSAMDAAGAAQLAADNAAGAASDAQDTADEALNKANASLKKADNLSDLSNAEAARANLGLGSMAVRNVTISTSDPSGGADGDIWIKV